jgi:tetratricopeptide (TPR) repeat protein
MARSKRQQQRARPGSGGPRALGLRLLQAGRLDEAIAVWESLQPRDAALTKALAEAYFRRALSVSAEDPLGDLGRALKLAPDDTRIQLQLGRLQHRAGQLAAADSSYAAVLAREPEHVSAGRLRALLALERQPTLDLAVLPWVTPRLQAWAAPAQALLDRDPPPDDDSAPGRLWRGLDELIAERPEALATLSDERSLPSPALNGLRRYLRGVAAARAGNAEQALTLWQAVYEAGEQPPGLAQNLAALLHGRLEALAQGGDVAAAAELAQRWQALPGGPAFDELRIRVLDTAAQRAAADGDWSRAATYWEAARQILALGGQDLGSPRPLLHNLALAYERLEQWEQAADAWRAMLRTRARRRPDDAGDALESRRWAWVRSRIIDCYKQIGRPDEAVTVFRQALKQEPNDLDLRLQLADALEANEQPRAAQNEIKRILQIDPHHPEAALRQAMALAEGWQFAEARQAARELAAHHTDRPEVQQQVAGLLLDIGRMLSQYGRTREAYDVFVEGERYDPSNAHFPLNQARMLPMARRKDEAGPLIERALAAAGEETETWALAIETWAMADQIGETRALLERFERERSPGAEAYMTVGAQLLHRALPPPAFPALGRVAASRRAADTPLLALALETLDKALALRPDDMGLLKSVAGMLLTSRPDLARGYAERALQQTPDDPDILIFVGLAQGLNGEVKEGKATLQRAAQLAQRAGMRDLAEHARALRQAVGTPMLPLLLTAGLSDLDADDLEDLF